jgi:hypothetical protein
MIKELPSLGLIDTVAVEIIEQTLQPAVILFGRMAE